MSTIKELFARTSLDKVDAKVLMAHTCQTILNWPKSALISRDTDKLPQQALDLWSELEKRRLTGEPVAYLIGHRGFHEIELEVAPGVLIPRPETEMLVDIGLNEIRRLHEEGASQISVLDLGTGSGAIALAIANASKSIKGLQLEIVAVDQSLDALTIAQKNCKRLNLDSIVQFVQSDWYQSLKPKLFQLILSNPPYIPLGDPHLSEGDLRFEPQSALTDHYDGLEAYRQILSNASQYLASGSMIAVEHGYNQGDALQGLFVRNGFESIQTLQDLSDQDRVTLARIG